VRAKIFLTTHFSIAAQSQVRVRPNQIKITTPSREKELLGMAVDSDCAISLRPHLASNHTDCQLTQKGKTTWLNEGTSLQGDPQKTSFLLGKWCAQGDDFRTFLGDFVAALPQIVFPSGLNI
jgi:hypothetical protein